MSSTDPVASTVQALSRLGALRDPAAWSWLIDRHGEHIQRLAHRLIADGDLAQDAVQEVFLALRDSAVRFRAQGEDPEAAAVGWMMRMAWTTIIKTARNHRRRTLREQAMQDIASHAEPPAVADAELARLVAGAVDLLPERHRQPLVLHFHAGLGYPELAATLRITVNAARVRVHRAVAVLRSRLLTGLPTLTVALLEGHLGHVPVATASPQALGQLRQLLDSRRRAVPSGAGTMSGLGIGVGLLAGAVMVMAVLALAGAQAAVVADFPPPPPLPPQPAKPSIEAAYLDIPVRFDFSNTPLPEALDFITRVLRMPVHLDPKVPLADCPPVTLRVDEMPFTYALGWLCELDGLTVVHAADGSCELSTATAPPPPAATVAPSPRPAHQPTYVVDAHDASIGAVLRLFDLATTGIPDDGPDDPTLPRADRITFRAVVQHDRNDLLLRALLGSYNERISYNRTLHSAFTVPAFTGSVSAACAMLTTASGITIRLDTDSGPMPTLSLAPCRVLCVDEISAIAQAIRGTYSCAADGVVIYRVRGQRFLDADSAPADRSGKAYSSDRAPWWSVAPLASGPVIPVVPTVAMRILRPQWRGVPLGAVIQDLQLTSGLPVIVQVDHDTLQRMVSYAITRRDRDLPAILTCISAAAQVRCDFDSTHTAIVIAPQHDPTPAPAAAPPATNGPSSDQMPSPAVPAPQPVPSDSPTPFVQRSGG